MRSRIMVVMIVGILVVLAVPGVAELTGFIQMKDGYFYDSGTGKAWVPHGIAYQTWNRPLGVWQTFDQIDYDLDEMKKMGANSIRVDFVWQHIEEDGDNQFKWANYDYLVQAAEARGMRIFALIGYQWPPNWFPDEWYTMHPPEFDSDGIYHTNRWQSDIINYEHPEARAQYAEWLAAVAGRYKDSKAIAGWIVGNESGYLGLWSGLLDGYDPWCEQAFRNWCQAKYGTIANVNAAWGTSFASFDAIVFVEEYRAYGPDGAEWADMVQWREDSIASFTAVGAVGARSADTNHLISYSTVGMQWGEEDWRYHAEDRGKITAACLASGAPIDFFSVNNYPWSVLGHESQNGQWGVSYTKKVAKVPVLYTETGFTSSETMWPDMNESRQGPLVRNSLWESLEAGAVGTHIFSWMDRPYITDREKGFGLVYADRRAKPALWVSRDTFNLMDQVDIHGLLEGSQDPTPDIAFLWTAANDSQYNRYECEMQQIAGALERLGYEPNFIDLNDLAAGAYTNFRVVILPRNMRVEDTVPGSGKTVLNFLRENVIAAGVNVLAGADIPGIQNQNAQWRAQAVAENSALFGIDCSDLGGEEAPMRTKHYVSWYWDLIEVDFNANSPINGYHYWPHVWKYNDEIAVSDGQVWAEFNATDRNKGYEDSSTSVANWDGTWGDVYVRSGWGWQYEGNNMVHMWGDSGMWQDWDVVPFGKYSVSAYLRSNTDDALRNGKEAYVALEWYDQASNLLGRVESPHLATHTGNQWVRYRAEGLAPSNTWFARRIIRITGPGDGALYVDNHTKSPALVVKDHGTAKAAVFTYSVGDHKPDGNLDGDPDVYDWQWRYDIIGAVIKDYFGVQPQVAVQGANAYLCLPEYRTLKDGSTLWQIKNYLYDPDLPDGGAPQTFTISSPLFAGKTIEAFDQSRIIEENSDGTIQLTLAPDGMDMLLVYDGPAAAGSARGHWRMDEAQWPGAAGEVKDSSGRGNDGRSYNGPTTVWGGQVLKAGSFDGTDDYVEIPNSASLQVTGDLTLSFWVKPENLGSARINPVDKSYGGEFGLTIETSGQLSYYHGTARASGKYWSWAALPAGTLKNGEWQHVAITRKASTRQMKSYLNGSLVSTATYTTDTNKLPTASTYPVRVAQGYTGARLQGLVDEVKLTAATLSGGQVAAECANHAAAQIVRIKDAPALVHPLGDKLYTIKIGYDCGALSGLTLKCAFMEYGDNGDGTPDEAYQVLSQAVTNDGEHLFWMWIPDADQNDPDYISTPDGGRYQFAAWLEDASGAHVADATPAGTVLDWGVRPTAPLPTTLTKGQQVSIPIEWEDLYEYLPWEVTPLTRNDTFPSRVAVFRSLKTEAQFPGQLGRVNQVCDWLESMGYASGNPLDVSFDNVRVAGPGDPMAWGNDVPYTTYASRYIRTNELVSFKIPATENQTVDKIAVYLYDAGLLPVVLTVYPDNGGVPGTTPISTVTYTPPNTSTTWREFDLPNFAWQAGQTYHFVFSLGTPSTAYAYVRAMVPATSGRNVLRKLNGGSWSSLNQDPGFHITFANGESLAQAFISRSIYSVYNSYRRGERFIPQADLKVSAVRLFMYKQSTVNGDAKITLRKWSDQSVIASATVPASSVGTSASWVQFAFDGTVDLAAGTEYALVFENLGSTGYYYLYVANASGKPDQSWAGTTGQHIYSSNGGTSWTTYNYLDLQFYLEAQEMAALMADDFEDGNADGWTRVAGAANWTVENPEGQSVSHGQPLRYDKYTTYGLTASGYRLGFKITADASKTVDQIHLYTRKYGVSPVYSVSVYADNNGLPSGSPLASGTFTSPSTSYTWTPVDLTDFAWTEGQTYHFVVGYSSGTLNSTNYVRVEYVGPDTPGRKVLRSSNGGSSWTQYTYEPSFRIVYADGSSFAQPYATYSTLSILGNTRYGQQFTPEQTIAATNVAVFIRKQSTVNGDVGLRIRRWTDRSLVAESSVPLAQVATTNNWVNFAFQPSVLLVAGEQYFVEIVNLGTSGYYYGIRENSYAGYGEYSWDGSQNACVYSSNGGATWSVQVNYDLGCVVSGILGTKTLRASRIGNDDNMLSAGSAGWSDYTASVDIRYNTQGPYFNDAELYVRFLDRDNFYKVGIRNAYGFWRIVYEVRYQGSLHAIGILKEFTKADRPVEGEWYNLKADVSGGDVAVYFDGQPAGSFSSLLIPAGKVAVGSSATQLGIWEPQKGYYFIDDDEYSYYAPEGQPTPTNGTPLNLDWGYLSAFFQTLILPSTYVMSDVEVSNVATWLNGGLRSLIAIDGGIAMKNETGAMDLGRIEPLFGVAPAVNSLSGLNKVTVGGDGHYVTLDYAAGAQIPAVGGAVAWATPTTGTGLGTVDNGTVSVPALIANTLTNDPLSPKKIFCFNFGADTLGQLTGAFSQVAQRAFEWCRGEAYKVRLELKYQVPQGDPSLDLALLTLDGWLLTGSGTSTLVLNIPEDGIMTGENLYWVLYVYAWDAADPWLAHGGFYTSADDSLGGLYVSLGGQGLQILGMTENAYAGREWDMWLGYNTRGSNEMLTFGIKDQGAITEEDNFDDGDYAGWSVISNANIGWSVVDGKLRATVLGSGGYSYIDLAGLDVSNHNITVECDILFTNNASWGGLRYRGVYLDLNPTRIGWRDNSGSYFGGVSRNVPHHVVLSVRAGDPYMMSDLFVDDQAIFLNEPIETTSFANTSVGFVSPYYYGFAEWDSVRVADEAYTLGFMPVIGEFVPTNDLEAPVYVFVPDYDPLWWEHNGSAMGSGYEWFTYFRGHDVHSMLSAKVYFAPRLMVEDANFPTNMNAGDTVSVPVEWENLGSNVPAKLQIQLADPYSGATPATAHFDITAASGSGYFQVTVPTNAVPGVDYLWSAVIYPTNAVDPMLEKLGLDDTYRFNHQGEPLEPETAVKINAPVTQDLVVYSDAGIASGCDIYTWSGGGGMWDAHYTLLPPPEGTESFYTLHLYSWIGWGVFRTAGTIDLTEYTGGYLKFWLFSFETLKVELQGPQGTTRAVNVGSTGGTWQQVSIPLSSFSGINLAQMYGLFAITSYDGAEYLVDHIRFSLTP